MLAAKHHAACPAAMLLGVLSVCARDCAPGVVDVMWLVLDSARAHYSNSTITTMLDQGLLSANKVLADSNAGFTFRSEAVHHIPHNATSQVSA